MRRLGDGRAGLDVEIATRPDYWYGLGVAAIADTTATTPRSGPATRPSRRLRRKTRSASPRVSSSGSDRWFSPQASSTASGGAGIELRGLDDRLRLEVLADQLEAVGPARRPRAFAWAAARSGASSTSRRACSTRSKTRVQAPTSASACAGAIRTSSRPSRGFATDRRTVEPRPRTAPTDHHFLDLSPGGGARSARRRAGIGSRVMRSTKRSHSPILDDGGVVRCRGRLRAFRDNRRRKHVFVDGGHARSRGDRGADRGGPPPLRPRRAEDLAGDRLDGVRVAVPAAHPDGEAHLRLGPAAANISGRGISTRDRLRLPQDARALAPNPTVGTQTKLTLSRPGFDRRKHTAIVIFRKAGASSSDLHSGLLVLRHAKPSGWSVSNGVAMLP